MVRRGVAAVGFVALLVAGGASAALLTGRPIAAPSTTGADAHDRHDELSRGDARGHRARLRARNGDGAVGGLRLRAARLDLDAHPRPLLPRHVHRAQDAAPLVRVLLADAVPSVLLGSAAKWHVVDGAGTRLALPAGPLRVPASLRLDRKKLVSPLTFEPGKAPVEAAGRPYHGRLVLSLGREGRPAGQRRRARVLSPRSRLRGDAVDLAAGGARGSGDRCALLRAGADRSRTGHELLRSVRRLAQPGLRRRSTPRLPP